jgi:hypothetical protein
MQSSVIATQCSQLPNLRPNHPNQDPSTPVFTWLVCSADKPYLRTAETTLAAARESLGTQNAKTIGLDYGGIIGCKKD